MTLRARVITLTPSPRTEALTDVLQFMRLLSLMDHASNARRNGCTVISVSRVRNAWRSASWGVCRNISPGELASTLHVDPSTLTGILARLGGRRLIARVPDATDGRRTRLRLTPARRRLDRQRAATVVAAVRTALANSSSDEHAAAARLLLRVVDALEGDASAQRSSRRMPR